MKYHDYKLEGYSVRQNGALITIHLVYDYPNIPKDWSNIEFSGVIAYHFIHTGGAIITDLDEVPISKLVDEKKEDLADWCSALGALVFWNDDSSAYVAKLEAEGYRAWQIESAIGFSGFIIGKEAKPTEPNQRLQTMPCKLPMNSIPQGRHV